MTISSSLNNVKINRNTIDVGHSSNGTSPTTYTYDPALMSIFADAVIFGNTLSGCVGNGDSITNLINIVSGSCIITGNTFIRGSSTIAAYVNNAGTNDQIVTNNIFDQTTVDGASTLLVTGLNSASIFEKNLNQSKIYSIFNMQSVALANDFTSTAAPATDVTGMVITIPGCKAGDLIDIGMSTAWKCDTPNDGTIYATIVDGVTTTFDFFGNSGPGTGGIGSSYINLYTVLNDGSLVVKLQVTATGANTVTVFATAGSGAPTYIRTIAYRL